MSGTPYTELEAIRILERLAARWPQTLWLFADGTIHVMRYNSDGERAITEYGGMDASYSVTSIDIPCDGGDW